MSDLNEIANIISEEAYETHRGVIYLTKGDFLVFGNDGYTTDEKAKREVASWTQSLAIRKYSMETLAAGQVN